MSAQSETDQSKFAKICTQVDWTSSLNVDVMTVKTEMKNSGVGVFLRGNRVKAQQK